MKIPKNVVIESIEQADIWSDEYEDWMSRRADEYWEQVDRDMSWQWYMKLSRHKDWHTVIISKAHKNITVANWLKETYPGVGFEYEREHFLIEKHDVAMVVALQWT